ncbi:MAG: protein TolQ [Gammaproteobacteria bacterium]|nr:protein TolQ [Gammaproteobacteria bacterium]
MPIDLTLWNLFLHASGVVQSVMVLLFVVSIFSWTVILQRGFVLRNAHRKIGHFEDRFWSGIDLKTLYESLHIRRQALMGLERIFHGAFKEYLQLSSATSAPLTSITEGVNRTLRVHLSKEAEELENHLPFLATVGSVSPYVGLFGTVWGIMHAFLALGAESQATLALVAPGIAEALIATAMGLFAAIPAVVAYNRYTSHAEKIISAYENFSHELTNILHRQTHIARKATPTEKLFKKDGTPSLPS